MALFGTNRDFDLFKKINNELLEDIIDTPVALYKIIKQTVEGNVYDENVNPRVYNDPVLVPALVSREEKNYTSEEFGTDYTENIRIAFFKEHLVSRNLYIESGDVVEYDNVYYEITPIQENQYFMGKKSSTWFGTGHGDSISIICEGHIINKEKIRNNENMNY